MMCLYLNLFVCLFVCLFCRTFIAFVYISVSVCARQEMAVFIHCFVWFVCGWVRVRACVHACMFFT